MRALLTKLVKSIKIKKKLSEKCTLVEKTIGDEPVRAMVTVSRQCLTIKYQ